MAAKTKDEIREVIEEAREQSPTDAQTTVMYGMSDIGHMHPGGVHDLEPAEQIETIGFLFEEFDLSDEQYHAAMKRTMTPEPGKNSEPPSSYHGPEVLILPKLIIEMVYELAGTQSFVDGHLG